MSATNKQNRPNSKASAMPESLLPSVLSLLNVQSTRYNETTISIHILERIKLLNMCIDCYIDDYGNIIVMKGNGPLYSCFCAHLDTVHIYPDGYNVKLQQKKERTYAFAVNNKGKAVGIGGDDKCGIFVCLYLLEYVDNIKIVFFSQEESGGTGSSHIDMNVFKNCNFLGGVDRWNGHDFVTSYMDSDTVGKQFTKLISPILKKYDYEYSDGLFTDAFNVMGRKINIPCFNMSCGYYEHHTNNEFIDLNELYHACRLATELCGLQTAFKYVYKTTKYTYPNTTKYDWWHSYKTTKLKEDKTSYCLNCGLVLVEDEADYCIICGDWMSPGKKYKNEACYICGIKLSPNESGYCAFCENKNITKLIEY